MYINKDTYETLALHTGYDSVPTTNTAATHIDQTTFFTFDDPRHVADFFDLKVVGNIDSRIMNPTNAVLKESLT